MNKNDKIVHTRVSKKIYDKISAKAKKHRVTTSNLIRNLVEDYLEIHNDVWEAIDKKVQNCLTKVNDSIIGYQTIILSKNVRCYQCHKVIAKKSEAFIGFFEKSSEKEIICKDCKQKNGH